MATSPVEPITVASLLPPFTQDVSDQSGAERSANSAPIAQRQLKRDIPEVQGRHCLAEPDFGQWRDVRLDA